MVCNIYLQCINCIFLRDNAKIYSRISLGSGRSLASAAICANENRQFH